jgi:hypothetical protein
MKIKGIKKTIKTETTIETTSIDSMELSGRPEDVNQALENVTKLGE